MYYKKKVAILKSSGKTQRAEVSTVVPCPVSLHYSSWGFHKLKQRPQRGPSSYKTLLRTRALDLWITRACRALTKHMGCTRLGGEKAWETLLQVSQKGKSKPTAQQSWTFWILELIRSGHTKDRILPGTGPI